MNPKLKQTIMAAVLASSAVLSTGTAAHADIDDWLRDTFSSRDWVGDWLKDTFGPVMNQGGSDGGKTEFADLWAHANEISNKWAPGQKLFDAKELAELKPVCDLPKLLAVVNKERTPEALIKRCFK